jgi:hypothetical protein
MVDEDLHFLLLLLGQKAERLGVVWLYSDNRFLNITG